MTRFSFFCLEVLILFLNEKVFAMPPLISDIPLTKESYTDIDRGTYKDIYSIFLAHIPWSVTADDFNVKILNNRLIKVDIRDTKIDWYLDLLQPIPEEFELIPDFDVKRLHGDDTGALWMVKVIIPRYFTSIQRNFSMKDKQPDAGSERSSSMIPDPNEIFDFRNKSIIRGFVQTINPEAYSKKRRTDEKFISVHKNPTLLLDG